MEETNSVRLDLRASLEYTGECGLDPFNTAIGEDNHLRELLFCFSLNEEQAGRIEPEAGCFLGELVFSGAEYRPSSPAADSEGNNNGPENPKAAPLKLPAGLYLFIQRRRMLSREECVDLAIEQQKDGLWERLRLENRLYIRRLFEDGGEVTQLFRPYTGGN